MPRRVPGLPGDALGWWLPRLGRVGVIISLGIGESGKSNRRDSGDESATGHDLGEHGFCEAICTSARNAVRNDKTAGV